MADPLAPPAGPPAAPPAAPPAPPAPPAAPPQHRESGGDGEYIPRSRYNDARTEAKRFEAELQKAQAELQKAQADLAAAQAEAATHRTTARRAQIRTASGIDDDEIADLAFRRYDADQDGIAEAKRPGFEAWWKGLAADEAKRGALPRALRVYAEAAGAAAPPTQGQPPASPRSGMGLPRSSVGVAQPPPSGARLTSEAYRTATPEQAAVLDRQLGLDRLAGLRRPKGGGRV